MAAPTGITAIDEQVIITVLLSSEIKTKNTSLLVGIVEDVGINVTWATVGQYVLFKTGLTFSVGNSSWQVVNQNAIVAYYVAV